MSRSSARRRPLRWSLNKLADQSRNYPKQLLGAHLRWVPSSVAFGILGSLGMALSEAPEPAEPGEPGEPVQPGQPGQPESEERPETSKDNYIKEDRVVSQARAHRMTGTGGAGLGRFAIC